MAPKSDPLADALAKANAKLTKGDYEGAVRDIKIILKDNDAYADAHYLLGYTYGVQGEDGKACKEFKRYLQMDPHGPYAATASQNVASCGG